MGNLDHDTCQDHMTRVSRATLAVAIMNLMPFILLWITKIRTFAYAHFVPLRLQLIIFLHYFVTPNHCELVHTAKLCDAGCQTVVAYLAKFCWYIY